MLRERNPFTPAFGSSPYVLAGRDDILDAMQDAFDVGRGDPNLSTLIIGARGTGKTALMSSIRSLGAARGWIAIGVTALPGMLEDIYEQVLVSSEHLVDSGKSPRLNSLSLGPVSATWENQSAPEGNWRTRMSRVLDLLGEQDIGLLVTVDEVQADLDELVLLAATYQHFVTEDRKVSLVMAGLPFQIDRLVSDKSVSFLRRCAQHRIGRIPSADVEEAFVCTVRDAGRDIEENALQLCVEAIDGFAYMLQLVGYRAWNAASEDGLITEESARRGVSAAHRDMEEHVLAATYRELSEKDIEFLEAMLEDERESRMSEIARRMGVSSGYVAKYRTRLLALGIIREVGRGLVTFDLPGIREYVTTRRADR